MPPRAGAPPPESPLLGRTRRQLVLWSAGSTVVVLALLGTALYVALAQQLASTSEAQLRERADAIRAIRQFAVAPPATSGAPVRPGPFVDLAEDPGSFGLVIGGPGSGTIALVVGPEGATTGFGGMVADDAALAEARAGRDVVTTTTLALPNGTTLPARVYTAPVVRDGETYLVQIVADRTAELETLSATLVVLLGGGLAVVLAAAAFGWLYAGRALVPIRESLRHQREFAADASHELRTPVTVVRGNVDLLRGDPSLGPTARAAVEEIDAEARRMTSLVDELLLLVRTDANAVELDLAPCDAAEEATDALEAFTPIAERRGIVLGLDAAPAPLRADRARLLQLFGILIDNAVRHAPDGGRVDVTVERRDRSVVAAVEDDGPGIRPEDLPRVFDRFWRAADAPEGGSGLGLAIARWIVERHDGTIRAERAAAGGARFVVELPAG